MSNSSSAPLRLPPPSPLLAVDYNSALHRTRRSPRRSSSDIGPQPRIRFSESPTESPQTALCVENAEGTGTYAGEARDLQSSDALLRLTLRHTSSSPYLEDNSRRQTLTIDPAVLQQQSIQQTEQTSQQPNRPWRVRLVRAASGPFQWANPRSPSSPGFYWMRGSTSSPSEPQSPPLNSKQGNESPLKPCIKPKSKSAATTPPNQSPSDPDLLTEGQTLRRVKTVDFDETVSRKLLSLPPLKTRVEEPGRGERPKLPTSKSSKLHSAKDVKPPTLCPGLQRKSLPAETAITRTAVHVVSIAPSRLASNTPDPSAIITKPATSTPTMQIVESKIGRYEVVWSDFPSTHDIGLRSRRDSSASQSLQVAGGSVSAAGATRGLERVNTKLTEWSWSTEEQTTSTSTTTGFQPRIVVYPDEDGRVERMGGAVDENEDVDFFAPPNSARMSRSVSDDEQEEEIKLDLQEALQLPDTHFTDNTSSKRPSLVVPDPDATISRSGSRSTSTRSLPSDRRLSNVDDSDVKFRGHRDSVALARSRIFNAGGLVSLVAPELLTHRDRVALSRKHMLVRGGLAKSHATASARPHSRLSGDADAGVVVAEGLGVVDERAVKGLKKSASASMLRDQAGDVDSQRHIRIVEL